MNTGDVWTVCTQCTFHAQRLSLLRYIFLVVIIYLLFTLSSNFGRKPHYVTANGKYSPNEMDVSVDFPRYVCTAHNGRLLHFVLKCSAEYLPSISATFSRFSQSHLLLMQPYLLLRSACACISEPISVFYFMFC